MKLNVAEVKRDKRTIYVVVSGEVKAVEVVTITIPAAVYHPPLPNRINTRAVEWRVLSPTIMDEYLTDLKEGNAPTNVYYGVSPAGYENLSINMAEIKRYIRQVLSIVTLSLIHI